jgi:transcriptional regulator with XRE-family HTH domain
MKTRIKALRVKNGLTQAQLGEILDVTQKAISLIEKGINKPSVSQIALLAEKFNVTTDYIINGNETSKDIEPIERDLLKMIRDDKTMFGMLIKMMKSKKEFFEEFEGLAA